MSAGATIAKAGAHATKNIRAVHTAALGAPPAWAGYWTFVTATIILAFILYVTKKGTLNTWVSFFSWTAPAPIGSAGATPSNDQSAVGQILNGAAGNASIPAVVPGQANPIPWGQVGTSLSGAVNGLLNAGSGVVPSGSH